MNNETTGNGVRVVTPAPDRVGRALRDAWRQRGLIWLLLRRELRVKYAQTRLGPLWSVLPVLSYLVVYSVFFSVFVRVETGSTPYPLFALSGLMAWNFFRDVATAAGTSLIAEADFLRKNYLPALLVPLYRSLSGSLELLAALLLFFLLMLIFGVPFGPRLLLLPLVLLLNYLTGFCVAIWTCALSIRRRDFAHFVSAGINIGIWATPVFYPADLVPEAARWLYYLNPMAGVLALWRWSALQFPLPEQAIWPGLTLCVLLLIAGLRRFVRAKDVLADYN